MKLLNLAFKEDLISVPLCRRHVQTSTTPGQTEASLYLLLTSQHAYHFLSDKYPSLKTFWRMFSLKIVMQQ